MSWRSCLLFRTEFKSADKTSSEFFMSFWRTKGDGHPCNFWLISIRILSSNARSNQAALVLYLLTDLQNSLFICFVSDRKCQETQNCLLIRTSNSSNIVSKIPHFEHNHIHIFAHSEQKNSWTQLMNGTKAFKIVSR